MTAIRLDLTADLDAAMGREWLRQSALGVEERLVFRGADGRPLPKEWWLTGAEIHSVTTDRGTHVWSRSAAEAALRAEAGDRLARPGAPVASGHPVRSEPARAPKAPMIQGPTQMVGEYRFCQKCGRTLKDLPSRKRGYGPECWSSRAIR